MTGGNKAVCQIVNKYWHVNIYNLQYVYVRNSIMAPCICVYLKPYNSHHVTKYPDQEKPRYYAGVGGYTSAAAE